MIPPNYGANQGTWFTFDPVSANVGNGAFVVNKKLGDKSYTDGLSKTLAFSEVKSYTAKLANSSNPATLECGDSRYDSCCRGIRRNVRHDRSYRVGRRQDLRNGVYGYVPAEHATCSTTTARRTYDVDFISKTESATGTVPTYAAITSRSYHAGVVNSAMMDGSVRTVASNIDTAIWRAASTRNGGETTDAPVASTKSRMNPHLTWLFRSARFSFAAFGLIRRPRRTVSARCIRCRRSRVQSAA